MKGTRMKAITNPKKRGRPRGELREWYSENLPTLKPVNGNGHDEVDLWDVFVPELDAEVTVEIPKGYVVIPPDLTEGKTQANVGQTARHEALALKLKREFVVHDIPTEVETGRGKNKKKIHFNLYALEMKE